MTLTPSPVAGSLSFPCMWQNMFLMKIGGESLKNHNIKPLNIYSHSKVPVLK